jgi:hypothetical protein
MELWTGAQNGTTTPPCIPISRHNHVLSFINVKFSRISLVAATEDSVFSFTVITRGHNMLTPWA